LETPLRTNLEIAEG